MLVQAGPPNTCAGYIWAEKAERFQSESRTISVLSRVGCQAPMDRIQMLQADDNLAFGATPITSSLRTLSKRSPFEVLTALSKIAITASIASRFPVVCRLKKIGACGNERLDSVFVFCLMIPTLS